MRIGRREFLESIAVGAGGLVLGCNGKPTPPPPVTCMLPPVPFDPYEMVPLGKTGLKLSRVGIGTGMKGWKRASNQTRLGAEGFTKLVRGAYDRGIRWFDLADLYGSHPFFAASMKGVDRSSYTIVSKIWWKPNGIPEPERPDADVVVKRFLGELKTDYIDIVQLHCVTEPTWPKDLRKQMDLLDALKDKGVIRAHGVTCHSAVALAAAAAEPWVDSVHARINPFGAYMDKKSPEKVAPALKKLHAAGKGVVGMKIIGQGTFRDSDEKRDRSVSYALNLGCIDCLLVGFEKLEEIDDFAARVRKVKRPAATS